MERPCLILGQLGSGKHAGCFWSQGRLSLRVLLDSLISHSRNRATMNVLDATE